MKISAFFRFSGCDKLRAFPAARGKVRGVILPLLFFTCIFELPAGTVRNIIPEARISDVHVLDQNWTDDEATRFYDTTQGSRLLPYTWFVHLEQANSRDLFCAPEHIRALG